MDGFELLNWIRQREGIVELPVVMLSASTAEIDRETARRLGAQD